MNIVGQSKKFLVSFLISALIFSLAALLFSLAFSNGRSHNTQKPTISSSELPGRTFNLLLILCDYSPDSLNNYDPTSVENTLGFSNGTAQGSSGAPLSGSKKVNTESMVIVRFDEARKKIIFVPLSGDTLVSFKGMQMKLCEIASEWGINSLIEKVHALTGLKIDNFASFSLASAAEAFALVGNIDYTVKWNLTESSPEKGININIPAGTSRFDGRMSVDLIRFSRYEGLGISRSDMITGFIKRIMSNLSNFFSESELKQTLSDVFELSYSDLNPSTSNEKIELMSSVSKLSIEYAELVGTWQSVGSERYFVLNETQTLEKLSFYKDK